MKALYDTIGIDYANLRRPDPRIAAQIEAALGDARTVLNVGAGTGSYEPAGREVTALEPSAEMIAQRPVGAAPAVQGSAESLPFPDRCFDAVMAVLTIHHWPDQARGLRELRRVARDRVVILTYDPAFRGQWHTRYWPALIGLDDGLMPPMAFFGEHLGPVEIAPVMVPHDCTDGFLYAYWRRPQAYLDPQVRKGSSGFWLIEGVENGATRLAADLASGAWHAAHRDLLEQDRADMGYRLVTARLA